MGIESGPQISCERALLNGAIVLEKWVIENSFGEEEDIEIEAVDHFAKCDKPVCVRGAKLVRKVFDKAGKKAGRTVGAGLVETYIHADGRIGAMVEVNCETDFVARTDEFKNLAHELAMQVAAMDPTDVEDLLKQEYIRDSAKNIEELVKETIAKVGENIVIRRFMRFELGE